MDLFRNTYPESIVNIKDESGGARIIRTRRPLHQPLFFIRAAQGNDKCEWMTGREAVKKYGDQTFDMYEKYYRAEQYFLQQAILPNQAAYIKRIIPTDAKIATEVIEAHLATDQDIPQYKRDEDGRLMYSELTGEPIQELDELNNPAFLKGCKVKFMRRQMTETEIANGYSNIPVKTVTDGTTTTKIYPLVALQFKSACEMGNKSGFKLYVDTYKQSDDLLSATQSLLWTFIPMQQPYNSNVTYEITDKFETKINQMVLRPNQVDPYTQRRISAEDVLTRLFYNDVTREELLPYDIYFYAENFEEIGNVVRSTEEAHTPELVNGWMVNIASMTNLDGSPYYTAILDTSDPEHITLSNLTTHYLQGGDDGDTSDEAFEEGVRQALLLHSDPELVDRFHYTITHLYDVGYSLNTKFAMADFMADQGYCKIIMTTQDSSRHLYSMDEATSVAAAIRARCALTPESELYGTQACRATIFAQAGYLNDTTIKMIIPMTFWAAERRSTYHNAQSLKGSWAAAPANVVNIYRQINFTPYTPTQKQLLWDGAANYIQWKNGEDMFMPSVRSVYKDATSLLSDDEFMDACVYTKYIIDATWTDHVSRKLPFAAYASTVQEDLNKRLYDTFGTLYTASTTVYLTEEDLSNHDTCTVDVVLEGDYPKRIWRSTIIVRGRSES